MKTFRTADVKIAYDLTEGTCSRPTIAVHGNLASRRWWDPLRNEFRKSSLGGAKSCFVAYDWRGCGETELPKGPLKMEALAGDLAALADEVGEGRKVDLIGHSTGGLIALAAMAARPEVFGSAVLLDPVASKGIHFDTSMWDAFRAMQRDSAMTAAVIGSTIHGNDPESPFFKDVIVPDAFHAVKTVGIQVLDMLNGLDGSHWVKAVKHPVLVLHGEHDQLLPMDDSKQLAQDLAHGQFMTLPGCGHCANVENPALLRETVQRFFS